MDVSDELQRLTEAEPLGIKYTRTCKRKAHGHTQASEKERRAAAARLQALPAPIQTAAGNGSDPDGSAVFSAAESSINDRSSTGGELWLLTSRKGESMASNRFLPSASNTNAAPSFLSSRKNSVSTLAVAVDDPLGAGTAKAPEEELATGTSYGMSHLDSPHRTPGSAESEKKTADSSRSGGPPAALKPTATTRSATGNHRSSSDPQSSNASPPATVIAHSRGTVRQERGSTNAYTAAPPSPSEERAARLQRHVMAPMDNCEGFDAMESASVRRRRGSFMNPTASSIRRASIGSMPRGGAGGGGGSGGSGATTLEDEYDELMSSVCSSARGWRRSRQPSVAAVAADTATSATGPKGRRVQQRSVPKGGRASEGSKVATKHEPTTATGVAEAARSSKVFDVPPEDEDELFDVSAAAAPPSLSPFQLPTVTATTATTDKRATATRRQSDAAAGAREGGARGTKAGGGSAAAGRPHADSPNSPLVSSRGSPRAAAESMRSRLQGYPAVQRASATPTTTASGRGRARVGSPSGGSSGRRGAAFSGSSVTTITVSDEDDDTFATSVSLSPLTSGNRRSTTEPKRAATPADNGATAAAAEPSSHAPQRRGVGSGVAQNGRTAAELETEAYSASPTPSTASPHGGPSSSSPTWGGAGQSAPQRAARVAGEDGVRSSSITSTSNTQSHRLAAKDGGHADRRSGSRGDSAEPPTTFPSVRKLPAREGGAGATLDGDDEALDDTPMTVLKERAAAEEARSRQARRTGADAHGPSNAAAATAVYVPPLPLSSITERRDRTHGVAAQFTDPPPDAALVASPDGLETSEAPLLPTGRGMGRWGGGGDGMFHDLNTTVTISPMSEDESPLPTASPEPTSAPPPPPPPAQPESSALRSSVAVDAPTPTTASATATRRSHTAASANAAAAASSSPDHKRRPTPAPSAAVGGGGDSQVKGASTGAKRSASPSPSPSPAAPPPATTSQSVSAAAGLKRRGFHTDAEQRGRTAAAYVPAKSEQRKCCAVM